MNLNVISTTGMVIMIGIIVVFFAGYSIGKVNNGEPVFVTPVCPQVNVFKEVTK